MTRQMTGFHFTITFMLGTTLFPTPEAMWSFKNTYLLSLGYLGMLNKIFKKLQNIPFFFFFLLSKVPNFIQFTHNF